MAENPELQLLSIVTTDRIWARLRLPEGAVSKEITRQLIYEAIDKAAKGIPLDGLTRVIHSGQEALMAEHRGSHRPKQRAPLRVKRRSKHRPKKKK